LTKTLTAFQWIFVLPRLIQEHLSLCHAIMITKKFKWASAFVACALAQLCAQEPMPVGKADPLPADTEILSQNATQAFAKKDWGKARTAYEEMLKLQPESALLWANLGAVEQQAGRLKEARSAFEKAVKYGPDLPQSWSSLGLICVQQGDLYLAVSMFTRAIHEEPLDPRAHNHLAMAVRALGWHTAAESELLRAIELDAKYGVAHFNLALLYAEQTPPSAQLAQRHYQKALALGISHDEVLEERLAQAQKQDGKE
jgi:Flp pilus assembly protein TadD